MTDTRILLAGFGPFGDFNSNPSYDALIHAANSAMFADTPAEVSCLQVPVIYDSAFEVLAAGVESIQPQGVVCFGLHSGLVGRNSGTFYVETTARNRNGAAKGDNNGEHRGTGDIVSGAPREILSTLRCAELVLELREAGFSAESSDDAGAYLCNYIFYRGAEAYAGRFPFGFVHVPPVNEIGGILGISDVARAVAVITRAVAKSTCGT